MRRRVHRGAYVTALPAAILAAFALAGCATGAAPTPPSATTQTPSNSPAPAPTPTVPPTVTPESSVAEARDVFDATNGRTLAANPGARGPDFIAGLEAAGFSREQLEVTDDTTSVGLEAGSIQFAARWDGTCLIGQNGAGSDGYRSQSVPVLATGTCLIGSTVPIG